MSRLHRGDENLHYCDNSHRWLAPPDVEQSVWEAGMRAHIDEHLATMGGPPPPEEPRGRQCARNGDRTAARAIRPIKLRPAVPRRPDAY